MRFFEKEAAYKYKKGYIKALRESDQEGLKKNIPIGAALGAIAGAVIKKRKLLRILQGSVFGAGAGMISVITSNRLGKRGRALKKEYKK
jgi:hypothetical protein